MWRIIGWRGHEFMILTVTLSVRDGAITILSPVWYPVGRSSPCYKPWYSCRNGRELPRIQSFQPSSSFYQTCGEREGFLSQFVQFLLVVGETRTETTQGVSSTDDDRIASSAAAGVFDVLYKPRSWWSSRWFHPASTKSLTVLSIHDSLYWSTTLTLCFPG